MQGTPGPIKAFLPLAALLAAVVFLATVALGVAPLYVHDDLVKQPGGYAPLYLYDRSPYDRIVIEVHYASDAVPSRYALEHLQSILHQYTGKTVDLYTFGDISPGSAPEYTDDNDLTLFGDSANVTAFGDAFIDAHARYRTGWLGGNVSLYVLYVNAGTGSRLNATSTVAGMSFRADAFVMFDNYLPTVSIERSVLVHEAGHLLGLGHDGDPGCAMTGILVENLSMLTGRTPPPDDYCAVHQAQLARERQCLFGN